MYVHMYIHKIKYKYTHLHTRARTQINEKSRTTSEEWVGVDARNDDDNEKIAETLRNTQRAEARETHRLNLNQYKERQ